MATPPSRAGSFDSTVRSCCPARVYLPGGRDPATRRPGGGRGRLGSVPQAPTLRYERPLWRAGAARVVGVDEVGVAPTCGAVVAAAVIIRPNSHRIRGVRDSKTLSAAQRERLAPLIQARAAAVGIGAASVAEIDRLNIYHATHLAMRRAIARIGGHDHVLVDGDARCYTIACASVVAKVVRDRMMARLADRYPGYGWERNQGYATLEHRQAIRRQGLTPFHRRSFLALQRTLAGDQLGLDLFGDAAEPPGPGAIDGPSAIDVSDLVADLAEGLELEAAVPG